MRNTIQVILQLAYPGIITHMSTREKILFLTFDDGPHPETTPWILDTLSKYNAQATFFLVGKNAEMYPHLVQRILSQGHAIGNHTYNHPNGFKVSTTAYIENVEKAASIISTNLFRPPYGKITPAQYRQLKKKYKIILWDVLSRDYDPKQSEKKCIANVITKARDGSIVVMHDGVKAKERLMGSLSSILDFYSERFFSFNKIEY